MPRPDLTQFTNSLSYLSEQKTRLIAERTALDEQREELQNQLGAAQNQLSELRGSGGRSYKTVTVRVSAPQPGNLALALSYTVPGASWSPSYDARVLSSPMLPSWRHPTVRPKPRCGSSLPVTAPGCRNLSISSSA